MKTETLVATFLVVTFSIVWRGHAQALRFISNGDGTVTDSQTGLMWVRDPVASQRYWSDNLAACESLTTGGFSDWRLPNAKEVFSIVDLTRAWPALDTTVFGILYHVDERDGPALRGKLDDQPELAGPDVLWWTSERAPSRSARRTPTSYPSRPPRAA